MAAKLRELRDQPYDITTTGLWILSDKEAIGTSTVETSSSGRIPRTRMCHLCGTPQLLRSYAQHFRQCSRAWMDTESAKPASERRSLPAGPRLEDGGQPTADTPMHELEAFNRDALAIWKSQALETCPNCGRSFYLHKLKRHMKGCHSPTAPFLGTAFVAANPNSRRAGESSRTYRTVQQSLERSPRVNVSKAGPIKLDPDRVEALRVVPQRGLSETAPTTRSSSTPKPRRDSTTTPDDENLAVVSPQATRRSLAATSTISEDPPSPPKHERPSFATTPSRDRSGGPSGNATTTGVSSKKGTPTRTMRRRPGSLRSGSSRTSCFAKRRPSRPGGRVTKRERDTTSIEARLDALEATQTKMATTLLRIEALFERGSSSAVATNEDDTPKVVTPTRRKEASYAREHELFFRGHIDLAWPDL